MPHGRAKALACAGLGKRGAASNYRRTEQRSAVMFSRPFIKIGSDIFAQKADFSSCGCYEGAAKA
jgi:hypothetical protein